MFGILLLANIALGITIIVLINFVQKMRESGLFHIICIIAIILLFWAFISYNDAQKSPGLSSIITMATIVIALASYVPFSIFLVYHYASELWKELMSEKDIKPPKTYDRAEAAEKLGNMNEALSIYTKYIKNDPMDPEPHRRMAEIYVKLDAFEQAIECFKQSAMLSSEEGMKIHCYLRIWDILTGAIKEPQRAIDELSVSKDFFQIQKYKDIIEERINLAHKMAASERKKK